MMHSQRHTTYASFADQGDSGTQGYEAPLLHVLKLSCFRQLSGAYPLHAVKLMGVRQVKSVFKAGEMSMHILRRQLWLQTQGMMHHRVILYNLAGVKQVKCVLMASS